MKIAILINESRASPKLLEQLSSDELKHAYHVSYDVFIGPTEKMKEHLKNINYKAYNAVLIGGGDGTVRTIIQTLIDENVPVAILPLGTFNLLAKDIGHINDIEAILSMIKNNKTKQIDLAEVNGKIIINHAWIGFYYYILKSRKKHKTTLGKSRLLKLLFSIINVFKGFPIYQLKFKTEQEEIIYKTCLVYISNNESDATLQGFAERKSLSSGMLCINILRCQTRFELLKCIVSILISGAKNSKYIIHFNTQNLTVEGKQRHVPLVIDGDLFQIDAPLNFTVHQKKLMVFVP